MTDKAQVYTTDITHTSMCTLQTQHTASKAHHRVYTIDTTNHKMHMTDKAQVYMTDIPRTPMHTNAQHRHNAQPITKCKDRDLVWQYPFPHKLKLNI